MSTLYSNLKFLSYSEHLEAIRERRVLAPVHIRIKPTNRCNHDCWYCAYHVDNLQLGEEMDQRDTIPEAKMLEIIDDIVEMGVRAVTFSGGGEPLIYKPLPECVERLAAGGVKVAALTNGSNLKGRVAEVFAEHGTWLRVSLDGWDEASYSHARGVPEGTFGKLLDNLRAFVHLGSRCVLGASYIIDQHNHAHVADACRILRDVGLNHVKLSGVVVGNGVDENNRYHAEIRDQVERQIELARELENDDFTVVDHYHELAGRVFEKSYDFCPFLQFQPVIAADCRVYTCHDKAYNQEGLLGSIEERSFRDFWFSEENHERIYSFNPSRSCHHHCTVHSKNLAILEYLALDPEHIPFV
ncbi:MAG: radical SAM protein [Gammaproteobacteria bacterium SHHR-1]